MQLVSFISLCSRFRRAPRKVVVAAVAVVEVVGSATVASDAAVAADDVAKL